MANKWFKHFNDALLGDSLQNVLAVPKHGHQYVVLYFYILECLSRSHSESFDLDLAQVSRRLRLRLATIRSGIGVLSEYTSLKYSECGPNRCQIHLPNWSELQTSGDKIKTKNKIKNKTKKEDKDKDKEYSSEGVTSAPTSAPKKSSKPAAEEKSLGAKIWDAYSDAYFSRYNTEPKRNATTNAQATNLGKRLGEDAIAVVQFYLTHNDAFFVREQHTLGLCLSKAEGLHTQWKTGKTVTGGSARKIEQSGDSKSQMQRLVGKHHG